MKSNVSRRALIGLGGAFALAPSAFCASGFPFKPVTIVLPVGVGGAADVLARTVADKLAPRLGQPVVVESRPGAGGTLAANYVSKALPDGHTLLLTDIGANAIAPGIYSSLPYDAVTGFEPVSWAVNLPIALVVNPAVPATSVPELIAYARSRPDTLNFASVGNGNIAHLAGELFKKEAGIQMQHVPYKSTPNILADLVSGQVQLTFTSVTSCKALVQAGKLRFLAAAGKKRSVIFPDVPTVAEGGLAGFDVDSWQGFSASAGTPADIVDRLAREISAVLSMSDVRDRLEAAGFDVVNGSPRQFAALIQAEVPRWKRVAQIAHAKID